MGEQGDSGGVRRGRVDGAVKARFLAAVAGGALLEEAARAAGVSLGGLYGARRRDGAFRAAWQEERQKAAIAASAAGGKAPGRRRRLPLCPACRAAAERLVVTPANGRKLQKRPQRHVIFSIERQEIYLAHFAGTGDHRAAAAAACVSESTVWKKRRKDPVFAEMWQGALETAYARLEAEAVRQRLEMAERLRDAGAPVGEVAGEFERVLKLLDRWTRKNYSLGPRQPRDGRLKRWSFDEAMTLLEKKLRALGYRPDYGDGAVDQPALPPPSGPTGDDDGEA